MRGETPLRVLVVEDEALLAMQIEALLREAGYEPVGQAVEAREAVELARVTHPQLALVDLNLRDGRSGPDVMRELTREHSVVGLFITANRRLVPADFAGAAGVLSKPFTERAFLQALTYLASQVRGERAPVPATASLELATPSC
jgi:two-component system, response regulator PdtaR